MKKAKTSMIRKLNEDQLYTITLFRSLDTI